MTRPIVALVYDFDNTLSTRDMQEYSVIPSLGMGASEFWNKSDQLANTHRMDYILSTMMLMVTESIAKGQLLTRDMLVSMGKDIQLYRGVEQWFERINAYGDRLGLEVRHYIISCGLRPMIEGSSIARYFTNIFACDYVYDDHGNASWPSVVVNYSSKIQYLFRINKGVEDIVEHNQLNMHSSHEDRPIPFENIIYFGDGITDVPSMKITRQYGGHSIGVYKNIEDAMYLVEDKRVDFYVETDYSEGSLIDTVIHKILDKISVESTLDNISDQTTEKRNDNRDT